MRACIMILSICTGILLNASPSSHASEDNPLITDDEEYAVFAALLFPGTPKSAANIIDPARKDSTFLNSPSLDGIPSDFFNLSRRTSVRLLTNKKLDRTIVDDFNRKNSTEYQIDPDKFAAVTPKGSGVTLITPKRFSMDDKPRRTGPGTTYISRPGFNRTRTEAVIEVSHVADPEMGIGYQVMLNKSPQDGTWRIVDAIVNRMY
ncbi:MAG: hypothetical protein PHD54_08950 [Desulfuromonadaceae bacterium]|nr:hypothetical protein [Desulfuromonadaceae bacterium]